jgi:hypothetical protein
MRGGKVQRLVVPLAIAAIVATAHSVGAHPLHTSLAEIVFDPAAKEIRVSIRVFADDLKRASDGYARSHAGTRFPVIDYVRSAFVIADRAGHPVALASCGAKPVGDLMWLCFRATGPAGPAGFRVTHKVLFDLYTDQINIVQASYGGKKVSLLYTRGDGFKRLD